MKPIALLGRPPHSRIRTITLAVMYAYLFLAVILLAVKAGQLAGIY